MERKRENTPGECGRPTGVSDPLTPGDSEGLALEDSGSGSSSASSETMLVGAGIRTKPALYSEMEEEGYSRDVVKVALSRLVKAKHISDKQRPSLSVPFKEIPGSRRTSIEVEKAVSGHAIVWVDGKWRARLIPENYAGPRELIRKGRSFDALCSLYDDAGTLCVNVRQVVQARQ